MNPNPTAHQQAEALIAEAKRKLPLKDFELLLLSLSSEIQRELKDIRGKPAGEFLR